MNLIDLQVGHAVTVFLAFFAVMNPISLSAVFVGFTGNRRKSEQTKIAMKALSIAFVVILSFAILGKTIFHLFGITLTAMQITGGILLFIIGFKMLHGENAKSLPTQKINNADVAMSPLGVPLLAGPGTITTAMNYSAAGGWFEIVSTVIVFFILCVFTFCCFIFSAKILSAIGENGLNIITSLMGLIVTVVGTQMLIVGLLSFIKLATLT
jgi:multiple antibiotic resistance protein